MPLTEKLVYLAAVGYLIFKLALLVIPILRAIKMLGGRFVLEVDLMYEIFSVEEIALRPSIASAEALAVFLCHVALSHEVCHFSTCRECGKIKPLKPSGRAEKLHIKRVMLAPLKHAVTVSVPFV